MVTKEDIQQLRFFSNGELYANLSHPLLNPSTLTIIDYSKPNIFWAIVGDAPIPPEPEPILYYDTFFVMMLEWSKLKGV